MKQLRPHHAKHRHRRRCPAGSGVAQKRHDGEALRGALPLVPVDRWHLKDRLGDLALGGSLNPPIMGLEHVPGAQALLARQSFVGRNSPSMDHGKKSIDRIQPGEPVMTERHKCDQCSGVIIRLEYLKAPFATDINERMEAVPVGNSEP